MDLIFMLRYAQGYFKREKKTEKRKEKAFKVLAQQGMQGRNGINEG
jgi:hypothetical protein